MVKNRLFDILISLTLERLESTPKIFDSLEVHSRRLANNIMLHIKPAISIKLKQLQLQTLLAEHPFCLKGDSRKDQRNHNTPARVMTEPTYPRLMNIV